VGFVTLQGTYEPPNGVVDFLDIAAVVDRFVNRPEAPPLLSVDLYGCAPDQVIDFRDIGSAVDAFKHIPYMISTGCSAPCP
jgi:hypothetical protein